MADELAEVRASIEQRKFNVLEMEHQRATNFSQVYANNASFGITFFDFSITFGQILAPDPNSMLVEDRATITMSLEHAKALMNALQETLVTYEKTHGPIRKAPTPDKV